MDDLEKLLNKQLENEDFKKEWEEFQPELQLMKKVIGEKIKQNRGETKMDDLEKLLNKQLENEDFKKEWEEFQPELQLMKKVIGEKIKQNKNKINCTVPNLR